MNAECGVKAKACGGSWRYSTGVFKGAHLSFYCQLLLCAFMKIQQYDHYIPDVSKNCYKDAWLVISSHLC